MAYTRYRRSSTFSSTSDLSGCVSSPSIEPEAWLPQQPRRTLTPVPPVPAFESSSAPSAISVPTRSAEPPDLFEALIHDRGRAYRHSSISLTSNLSLSNSDETRSLARALTSSWTDSPPPEHHTHVPTLRQQRFRVRSPDTERESTDRSMAVIAPTVSKRRVRLARNSTTKSKGKTEVSSQKKRSAAALGDEDFQKRASKVAKVEAKANICTPVCGTPKAGSPNTTIDPKPDATHVVQDIDTKDEEIQHLRRDLQSANEEIHRLERELEKKDASASLDKQTMETKHTLEELRLARGIEDEKMKSAHLAEQVQDSSIKRVELEDELRLLRVQYDQERRERRQEKDSHAGVLEDMSKTKAERSNASDDSEQVKTDNERLSAENISLKAKAASVQQDRAVLSPVPSMNSSIDSDRKEDNIRKIYIKTRRQYDVLLAATKSLVICSRSMDLSCFGDFGIYIAKLRHSLEGEASPYSQQAQVVLKEDEDIGTCSQGSRG